jgi:predicted secreted hydrolase
VRMADETMYCVPAILTTILANLESPKTGQTYFLDFNVEIDSFDAVVQVHSLMESQEFTAGPVYEGVAMATGTFAGIQVHGDAWNEQAP